MIVTTERLQYLWAVAEYGSFSAAGRKLGVSGAAVQQAIQAFEFDLEVDLFERSAGKKPSLSLVGRQLYLQALDIIPKLEGIEKYAQALSTGQEPQLRIALHGMTLFDHIKQALVALRSEFPTLELVLLDAGNTTLKSDKTKLAAHSGIDEADIIIAPARLRIEHGGNSRIIDRIHWQVVVSTSHPLSKVRGALTIQDLNKHAQLFPEVSLVFTEDLIEGIRCSHQLIRYSQFYHLREMLIAGLGFGFYPQQLAQPLIEQGILTALDLEFDDGEMNWGVEVAWGDDLGPAGQWLIEYLTEG